MSEFDNNRLDKEKPEVEQAEIYFAAGCFWGAQRYFDAIDGVIETEVGYANGKTSSPTYEDVCRGGTDHAEVVRVVYDKSRLSLAELVELYFGAIDPLAVNRQGNDVGRQYRSGIYYRDSNTSDAQVIRDALARLSRRLSRPSAIEARPLDNYYRAEEYHQKYLNKHPGGYCHIDDERMARVAAWKRSKMFSRPDEDSLRAQLTPLQYAVTQKGATEPPFHNEFWNESRRGIYVDVTTGEPLFSSSAKFDAGCGWPSFFRPIDEAAIESRPDLSHGMVRTEVRSQKGEAHLGHVFDDGPRDKGGLRYCINSAALKFIPEEEMVAKGYGDWLSVIE